MEKIQNSGPSDKGLSLGEQSKMLWGGPIRQRRRDRYGELIEQEEAIHGQEPPALPLTARIDRIRQLPSVERTDAEAAYIETWGVLDAFPEEADEIKRALADWRRVHA